MVIKRYLPQIRLEMPLGYNLYTLAIKTARIGLYTLIYAG